MTIEEKVQAVLLAAAGVTALASTRIAVATEAQLVTRPYIRHMPISAEPIYTYVEGVQSLKRWRYQVSCFGDSYAATRRLADAVRASMENLRESDGTQAFWINDGPHIYEDDVRVHHIPVEFEIVEAL